METLGFSEQILGLPSWGTHHVALPRSFSPGSPAAITDAEGSLVNQQLWGERLVLGFGPNPKLSPAESVPDRGVSWEGVKIIC